VIDLPPPEPSVVVAAAAGRAPALSYGAELRRKALHLGALVLPVGLLVLGREAALRLLVPLAVVALATDVARQRWPAVRGPILRVFAPIMRPEELPPPGGPLVLNGAVWMCLAAALCAALFPPAVAAAALAMQQIGDGAAAVVGRRFGRVRYPGQGKTLEGTAAFVVAALASAWLLARLPVEGLAEALPLGRLAVGALVAAVVEALPVPPNDNLRVPVAAAAAMLLVG
jgi:dolichol kinase